MARAWRKPPWPGRTSPSRPPAALISCSRPAFTSCSRGLYTTLGMAAVRMSGPPYPATADASCMASLTTWGAVFSRQATLWPAANRYGLQCSYASLTASPRMCWGTELHPAKLYCPPAHWLYGEATAATVSASARPGRCEPVTYLAAATATCSARTGGTSTSWRTGWGCSSSFPTTGSDYKAAAASHSTRLVSAAPLGSASRYTSADGSGMAGGLGTGMFSCSPLLPALALISAGASEVKVTLYTKPGGGTHKVVTATTCFYNIKEGLGSEAYEAASTTQPFSDYTKARDRGIGRPSYEASNTAAQTSQARSVTSR